MKQEDSCVNQSIDAIAENLRSLRDSRGLSLDQLAELTGVSKSMLRQIETGKSSPTIATLWKVANGLHISFTALLSKPEMFAEVKPFRSCEPLTTEKDNYRLFPLVTFSPQQPFEVYYIEVDPGTSFQGSPHKGTVYEYIFVTSGSLAVNLGEKDYIINKDEYFQFLACCEHEYKCISSEPAKAIMQLSYLS